MDLKEKDYVSFLSGFYKVGVAGVVTGLKPDGAFVKYISPSGNEEHEHVPYEDLTLIPFPEKKKKLPPKQPADYAKNQARLKALVEDGESDTQEAQDLADRLDLPWRQMTAEQKAKWSPKKHEHA